MSGAEPSTAPNCRMVFITPAAALAICGCTLCMAMLCNGANVMPSPKPAITSPVISSLLS